MKIKLQIILTILLVNAFQAMYGQDGCNCNQNINLTSEPAIPGELYIPGMRDDASTYFNINWISGDIYFSNGKIVRNKLLRYNGLVDLLFWKDAISNNIIKIDKEAIQKFHFSNIDGDTSVVFERIKIKRNNMSDSSEFFGQIIIDGPTSLFVIHSFKYEREELVNLNGTSYLKDIYIEEPIYYFVFSNNRTFITRTLNKRTLYSFVPGNNNLIKEFFKSNKIGKISNNSDLIKLTGFLETIINK